MHCIKVFLTLICAVAVANGKKCRASKPGETSPCLIKAEGGDYREATLGECENDESCCIRDSKCVFEMEPNVINFGARKNIDKSKKLDSLVENAKKVEKKANGRGPARFLGLGGIGGSPFPCEPPKPTFPASCKISATTPYVFDPPVNVPYCVRIPCDPYSSDLDTSFDECIKRPGCYFDVELSNYRRDIGKQIMPGAPVCHLAIRNPVFHREANNYIEKYGFWNPYYTSCLLESYAEEIQKPVEGCALISVLEYFGQKPKMAGWNNITPRSCAYIGACWLPGRGCFYPVDVSRINVKSGQQRSLQTESRMEYGRPKCQHFDDRTSRSALQSYHECLLAGCTVDPKVSALYYNYMYDVGNDMNATDHWLFWSSVQQGKTTADNIEEFEVNKASQRSLFLPTSPLNGAANQLGLFSNPMTNAFMGLNPNMLALNALGNKQNPLLGSFLSQAGQSAYCGPAFMLQGGRPCKPPSFNIPNPMSFCPYVIPSNLLRLMGPLKGSVEGCCDINLCYLPKSEISQMHSGASHYYTEWSFWTHCSKSCGAGTKLRHRKCVGPDGKQCTEPLTQERDCQTAPCPAWAQWGPWAPCSKSCATGIQTSKRRCLPDGAKCVGEKERVQQCNNIPCLRLYTDWGPWVGSCEPCGTAIFRTRKCVTGKPCSEDKLREIRRCGTQCGSWGNWGQWSRCSYNWAGASFTCQKSRTRSCKRDGKQAVCKSGSARQEDKCECGNLGR